MAPQNSRSTDSSPSPAAPADSLPRKVRNYWGSTTILGAVCLIVVGVHVGGLNSLMRFVGEREAWFAEKRQVDVHRNEWKNLVKTYEDDVAKYKADATTIKTKLAELDRTRTQVAEEVAALQGRRDAMVKSRDAALALEQRAKQDEQTARDAEQSAEEAVAKLAKQKTNLESDISILQTSSNQLTAAVASAQATHKRQSEQLDAQNAALKKLDDRLIEMRTELRTRSDELITLSNDVSKLQQDKVVASETLANFKEQQASVEKLKSTKAALEGEMDANKKLLTELEKDLSKQHQLLVKAKTSLAPYYLDVEKRDQIKEEIDAMDAERKKMLELGGKVRSGLDDLKADVAAQQKLLADIRQRVESLRREEADVTAKVLSTSRALKEQSKPTDTNNGKIDRDETNGGKDVTAETAPESE